MLLRFPQTSLFCGSRVSSLVLILWLSPGSRRPSIKSFVRRPTVSQLAIEKKGPLRFFFVALFLVRGLLSLLGSFLVGVLVPNQKILGSPPL